MSGVSTATMLAGAAIATSVAGTAVSVMGQSRAADAAAKQAEYQSQVARNNQQIMERNAKLAEQQGAADEERQRLKTGQIIGSQRSAIASQGGDPNSGSYLDILGDTASAGETDALTIRSNAALRAYGFRAQGANAGAQAGMFDLQSANATGMLPFTIGSTLLSGASSVAGKWAMMSDMGGKYSLEKDTARTRGDADLGGYNWR